MRATASSFLALMLTACAASSPSSGASWNVLRVAEGASLRAVSVPSPEVVWCSGSGGVVLRSLDGGRSFVAVSPPASAGLDFRSLVAFDRDRALVASAGTPARCLSTADGGSTWTTVCEDRSEGAFFDALAFADARRGYLLGDPLAGRAQLLATDDGGLTFRSLPEPPMLQAGEAMFAASCGCLWARGDEVAFVTGGSASRVFRSRDRGQTWSTSMLPLQQGRASQGAFAIAGTAAGEFLVVGGDYQEPTRRDGTSSYTEGGGTVWRRDGDQPGYCSGVTVLADGRTAVAVGPRGAFCSRDGGATWQAFGDSGFHAVAPLGAGVIAVGADGRVGTATP